MGKKQRDCAGCGAPVGFIGREHCCLCLRRIREQEAKAPCPGCGKDRVLTDTGRCVLCSRRCTRCGGPVRAREATLCRDCRRRAAAEATKSPCPRCTKPGLLRAETGWCGSCSRPPPPKDPPRICQVCGQLRRHCGLGMCSRCWQADPDRARVRGDNLITELDQPPPWLSEFVDYLAARYCPARAAGMVGALGRLLADEHPNHPQAVLGRARRPGRSIGSLARCLEDFFAERRLALPTGQAARLAAGRRQRRVDAAPAGLRPAVQSFAAALMQNRERALRAGTRPRTDHTIESALGVVRDLSRHVAAHRHKTDWALVDVHDIEAFLALLPRARSRRLTVLRQFFRVARTQKVVLVDPTRGLAAKAPRGFTGSTLLLDRQRVLFRRWTTDPSCHPHETLLGILALLHGASSQEVRLLRHQDINQPERTLRLGRRPAPVPMDPASWSAVQRCLSHRAAQRTQNPHVVVTRATKAGKTPASAAYFAHLLDPSGIPPRTLRGTRLADLVNTMDPKLVAAAFGMNPEGVMFYLTDYVDEARLPATTSNP
jgi:hypothetical protein